MPTPQELKAAYKKYGPGGAYDYTNHGGAAATPGSTPPPTDFSSTATDDPRMASAYDRYLKRMDTDVTDRAIDRSNTHIMDAAALGAADAKGGLAARGIVGTGAGASFVNRNITQPAVREAAGKAADISLGRERDLDAMSMAGVGLAGDIAGNNLAQRDFGLRQFESQQMDAMRRAQMEQEQRNQELAQMMAITQMMGTFDQTFPGGISGAPATGPYGGSGGGLGSSVYKNKKWA